MPIGTTSSPLPGTMLRGEAGKINLTLYWQVESAPGAPLKRFVHVVDKNGQIVAQADNVPANGALPMPYWRAGEYVMDQVELQVSPEASVATLCVGWYQPESGRRLPVRLSSGETASSVPDHQLCLPLN